MKVFSHVFVMPDNRIHQHPVIKIPKSEEVIFFWKGLELKGKLGEPISSALMANGITIFGYHPHDNSPQSLFCANGQCSQCMVIANGKSVKACINFITEGMRLEPVDGIISLPTDFREDAPRTIGKLAVPVLIIGGGPAGLSAAYEIAREGIQVLLVDDKQNLGGKLLLQTHRFFGSADSVYAGMRGIEIAKILLAKVSQYPSFTGWTNSTALAIFSDKKVGILKNGNQYVIVKPDHVLIATGAREKSLCFPGNTLPGIFGAGAFQTLVNRDLISPGKDVCIVGGGNVGLITGYHAMQAGVSIMGLIEFMPDCSGYKVHQDNLRRMGVPFYLSHTVLSANGAKRVESITIAKVDKNNEPIPGTQKTLACDCLLIAVGLNPVDEFYQKALEFGFSVRAAGDADEIAEASAAIISGKINALKLLNKINGKSIKEISIFEKQKEIYASKPGVIHTISESAPQTKLFPVIHCIQEIPCDPCINACPFGLIKMDRKDIRNLPYYHPADHGCSGCMHCVATCPGHAITLVDFRKEGDLAYVSLPFEFNQDYIKIGEMVKLMDISANELGIAPIINIIDKKRFQSTKIIMVQAHKKIAKRVAGYQKIRTWVVQDTASYPTNNQMKNIICRCERVTKEEILQLIRAGHNDMNEIKALSRAGMGACGGKTCESLILQLLMQEKLENKIILPTSRPLFCETPLSIFAGFQGKGGSSNG